MSIRFPKKNIVQHQATRIVKAKEEAEERKKQEQEEAKLAPIVSKEPPLAFTPLGPNANDLYPIRLHKLHEDVEMLGKLASLPPKERKALQRRLPSSLVQAENKADQLISTFVENIVKNNRQKEYIAKLRSALTPNAQLMLALRCYIAATTIEVPRNKIEIYRNKVMEAWDFFPASARKTIVDPKTGESSIMINYDEDNYKRQDEVTSIKHHVIAQITDPGPKAIDQLPKDWASLMGTFLENAGYEIETVEQAWRLIDSISKQSTIEERILSKIAYLVTHTEVHRKTKLLSLRQR